MLVPHLAIAHRELDRKIDRDACEQDAEADRDQVQGSDRDGGEQQGQHQAEPEGQEDRDDQPPGTNGQKQPQRNQQDCADEASHSTLCDRGELLVGQCHAAGDAHSRLACPDEFEPFCGLAYRLGRRAAGLKLAMIELGLHQHELVPAAEIGQLAAQEPDPRERVRTTGDCVRHRNVEPGQRG